MDGWMDGDDWRVWERWKRGDWVTNAEAGAAGGDWVPGKQADGVEGLEIQELQDGGEE